MLGISFQDNHILYKKTEALYEWFQSFYVIEKILSVYFAGVFYKSIIGGKGMKIAFFETKDYDRVWFGESAKDYGFEVCFIEDKLNSQSVEKARGCEIFCIPARDEFLSDEIITFKKYNVQALLMLVNENADSLKIGELCGIPVMTATRFSPSQTLPK